MQGEILPESDPRLACSARYAPAPQARQVRRDLVQPDLGTAAGAIHPSAGRARQT